MKAFKAYASGASATAETPRAAAVKFFAANPTRRKCNVTEGTIEGAFFVVRLSLMARNTLQSWRDVTKKTVETLPA